MSNKAKAVQHDAKIFPCSCRHDFQDEKYGKNKRVQNATIKGWRCTVCNKETLKQ